MKSFVVTLILGAAFMALICLPFAVFSLIGGHFWGPSGYIIGCFVPVYLCIIFGFLYGAGVAARFYAEGRGWITKS